MIVSLKKHHVKGTVKIRKYIVTENARRGLYSVMVNVWMKNMSLQIAMEPALKIKKAGSVTENVSPVKNLATENALKVNLNF
jgi:hypothetical protein